MKHSPIKLDGKSNPVGAGSLGSKKLKNSKKKSKNLADKLDIGQIGTRRKSLVGSLKKRTPPRS